jgi:hypothetical protein
MFGAVGPREMQRAGLLLLLALVSGCAIGPSRQQLLAPFIGVSETELVQRMGVPNRTIESGGIRFLAYDERRIDVIPGVGPFPGWGPWYYGYYGGLPPEVIVRSCETTFEIAGGRVRSFSLRGNDC